MANDHIHPTFGQILDAFNSRIESRADKARADAAFEANARRALPKGQCAFCDKHRNSPMMPSHFASNRCESGKHPHCTCNICF